MKIRTFVLVGFVAVLVALVVATTRYRGGDGLALHVAGDLGREVRDALLAQDPNLFVEINPRDATVTILTVTDWSKLENVPDAAKLCATQCGPGSARRMIRVFQPSPTGSRKHILLNIGDLVNDDQIRRIDADGPEVRCIARFLGRELSALLPREDPDDPCLPEPLRDRAGVADRVIWPWDQPH
ncbi:MAG: hypothetical protein AAF667_07215 [Pseudomonadota bacterium]